MKPKKEKTRHLSVEQVQILHDWILEFPGRVEEFGAWSYPNQPESAEEAARLMLERAKGLGKPVPPARISCWPYKPPYDKSKAWYISCYWFGFYLPKEAPL